MLALFDLTLIAGGSLPIYGWKEHFIEKLKELTSYIETSERESLASNTSRLWTKTVFSFPVEDSLSSAPGYKEMPGVLFRVSLYPPS